MSAPLRLLPARRLPLLVLLALAVALAALPAAEPAQAQAQYPHWSATLTVDEREQYHGCDDEDSSQANCSDASVLTDNDFTFDGVTYTLYAIYWNSNNNVLLVGFKDMFSEEVEPALGSLTLHVNGAQFAIADSNAGNQGAVSWPFDPNPDWTDGQKVSLRLTGPPPPPDNQKLLLSATLTVDEDNGFHGCYNGKDIIALANCTKKHALDNPKFKFKGTGYRVVIVSLAANKTLTLGFQGVSEGETKAYEDLSGAEAKAALGALTLHVDGEEFAVSGAGTSSIGVFWRTGLGWTEGQKVRLYLTALPPPEQVTGLKALRMDQSVRLTWDDMSSVPEWDRIEKMQYQQQARGDDGWGDWGDWTDIGLVGSYTVSGLTNGTTYNFRVRAVGPGGEGKSSRPVKAKPTAKPAAPTGLIANAADGAVILHWDTHDDYSTWTDDKAKWQYRERNDTKWTLVAERGANGALVEDSNGKSVPAVDPSSFTVTGLANGTDYDFQVRVRNDAGWSKPSAWSHLVTPQAPPDPPQGATVPQSWDYIPKDAEGNPLKPGEKFRLLFVTQNGHRATATDINWYNKQVQDALPGSFSSFAEQYRAVISTAAVNARDNIANDPKVPVY
ncbi:MAG: fibronectin type III domain-containing protein [Chloroflexi bacterium]|nr:fibronectin type III domain-containing protein [Chloroflexota bacterium]